MRILADHRAPLKPAPLWHQAGARRGPRLDRGAGPSRPPGCTRSGPRGGTRPARASAPAWIAVRIAAINPDARDQDPAWCPWGGRSHGGFYAGSGIQGPIRILSS